MTPPPTSFPAVRVLGILLAIAAVALTTIPLWREGAPSDGVVFVPPSGGAAGINQALARCAERGGEVRLGAGEYLCKVPIIINRSRVTLRGVGAATELKLTDNANCPVLVIGDEAADPRREVTGVTVFDLSIDGNREHQKDECWGGVCDTGEKTVIRSNGITIRRATNVVIERVVITRCRSGGVVTEKGCRRLTLRSLTATDNEFDGLACYETEDSQMTDLHLYDNKAAGISTDIRFNGNIVNGAMLLRNGSHGIFMRDSSRNLMQSIMIRDSGRQGIFIDQVDKDPKTASFGNSFVGLTVERSRGPAVRINAASCKDTLLSGCQFFDNQETVSQAAPGLAIVQAEETGGGPALKPAALGR